MKDWSALRQPQSIVSAGSLALFKSHLAGRTSPWMPQLIGVVPDLGSLLTTYPDPDSKAISLGHFPCHV